MKKLEFFIPGVPVAKGRARSMRLKMGKTIHYTPEKTVAYEGKVALTASAAMAGSSLIDGALSLTLEIIMPVPDSYSLKKRRAAWTGTIRPTKKPDTSNVLKGIEDGMNGVVYKDDAQIVSHVIEKRFAQDGEPVGVHVHVSCIGERC